VLEALAVPYEVAALPAPLSDLENDHAFFILLAGLVSVADWIGSNEVYFPYAGPNVEVAAYSAAASERAVRALDTLGWTGWEGSGASLPFYDLFDVPPRPLQEEVARLADNLAGPALVLIEAPMGEGKTEAAFLLADHWTHETGERGLYLALPTQATSNQMFSRTKGFLEKRYANEKVNLQLLHGQAELSPQYQEIRLACVGDDPGERGGEATGGVVAEERAGRRSAESGAPRAAPGPQCRPRTVPAAPAS
jgi:CRISPR-associated endonuclease/helicase Cas3